jgi:hypothetical protein
MIMPDLEIHDGHVSLVQISPHNQDINGPHVFFALMDELQAALKKDEDEGMYHDRTCLLKAYTDGCLYSLYIPWHDDMDKNKELSGSKDPIFMVTRHCIPRLLACCVVIDKEFDHVNPSVCHYLWTAQRARNKGIATYLLDEVLVYSVDEILPEAQAFWCKYLARVEVAGNDNESVTTTS